jgi:hypothetical protein
MASGGRSATRRSGQPRPGRCEVVVEREGSPDSGPAHQDEADGVPGRQLVKVSTFEPRPGLIEVLWRDRQDPQPPSLSEASRHVTATSRVVCRSRNVNVSMTTGTDACRRAPSRNPQPVWASRPRSQRGMRAGASSTNDETTAPRFPAAAGSAPELLCLPWTDADPRGGRPQGTARLQGADRLQITNVAPMAGIADARLDRDQAIQIDPVDDGPSVPASSMMELVRRASILARGDRMLSAVLLNGGWLQAHQRAEPLCECRGRAGGR